ncbi:MAG: serine hydrolase [Bacteroidota bacterium]
MTQTPTPDLDTLEAAVEARMAEQPGATVAVAVRDAHTGTTWALRGDRSFHAASTMKVPVMIEVYRQAEAGRLALTDSLAVVNQFRSIVDGSTYAIVDDSDDAIYTRLGTPMAVEDLVHAMITVSSNLATNLLIDTLAADTIQATAERLGVRTMRVLRGVEDLKAFRQGLSNTATANDLATLLAALRDGHAVSPQSDAAMVHTLKAQRFNTMIPQGLPLGTEVAHKTGWITEIHHDAAIVYPRDQPPYVLVILTEGIADETVSAQLGADVARLVHAALRPKA